MNILTLTVGLPRSGKSTWSRQQGVPVVCPDAIRLALHGQVFVAAAEPYVWAIARTMVAALFGAGHTRVILDATNTTKARRREWMPCDAPWWVRYREFYASAEMCVERALANGREDLPPIINGMASRFEPLESWEIDPKYAGFAMMSPGCVVGCDEHGGLLPVPVAAT